MRSRRAAIAGTILIVVMVAAFSLVAMPKPALACSCDGRPQSVADKVGQAHLAFVGSVVSEQVLDPPVSGGWSQFDLRYEVVVDHAVKGVLDGDRVVMFGDSRGTSCGTTELTGQGKLEVILSWSNGGLYAGDSTPACTGLPSIDEMLNLDLALPEVSAGAVSTIVAGRMGEAELIAFDAAGSPLAYADLGLGAGALSICPGSETFVHLEQDQDQPDPELVVRDTATLQVVNRFDVTLPAEQAGPEFFIYGAKLHCVAGDGLDVVALTPRELSSDDLTTLIRIRPGDPSEIVRTTFDNVSRAHYDELVESVIGVTDGELRSYPLDGDGMGEVVATVSVPVSEDYDAVFVLPDSNGGYWLGLGDGDYGVATRVRVLVRVNPQGDVERWPVTPPASNFDSAVLRGQTVLGAEQMLALPTPGSSDSWLVVPEAQDTISAHDVHLADGRSVVNTSYESATPFELIGIDGSSVALRQLGEVRHAISVPNGPITDPALVSLDLDPGRFTSEWISATEASPALAESGPTQETATTLEPIADTNPVDAPTGWLLPVLVLAVGAMFTLGAIRWRLRP